MSLCSRSMAPLSASYLRSRMPKIMGYDSMNPAPRIQTTTDRPAYMALLSIVVGAR